MSNFHIEKQCKEHSKLLRYALRTTTQEVHERLHTHPLTQLLLSKELTIHQYLKLLEAFYGFYYAIEQALSSLQHHYQLASRSQWLVQDLQHYKYDTNDLNTLPLCAKLPRIDNPLAYLGYCYVVEGSSLGSQLIYQHLSKHLDFTGTSGVRFFRAHGRNTGKYWQSFMAYLAQDQLTHKEQNIVLIGAKNTFVSLEGWLWQCYKKHLL
ncbi:MAG: biliverdin-producing heme oxygenase [Gammaproteobacteria bacterium]